MMDLLGCTYDTNQVGMFVWGAIPSDVESSRTLSDKVLYEADVFITPGYIFGERWDTHIRISLCTNVDDLREAKKRIEKLLSK